MVGAPAGGMIIGAGTVTTARSEKKLNNPERRLVSLPGSPACLEQAHRRNPLRYLFRPVYID
jgi:hypothetical protein